MRGRLLGVLMTAGLMFVTGAPSRAQQTAGFSAGLAASPAPRGSDTSWLWVHSGVAMQAAGSFADWATSWKQPEGNQFLAEPLGPYQGRFYREGTVRKAALSAGIAAVSYVVAWKWPRARKFIGMFNMTVGLGYGATAIRNVATNPYYKP